MTKSFGWIMLELCMISVLWIIIYSSCNGEIPGFQRGITVLIPMLVLFQWLLGSYSLLSAGKPELWLRIQYLVIAFAASLTVYILFYLATGMFYESSYFQEVIWPLMISVFLSTALMSAIVRFRYALTPQSRWLLIVNRKERDLITKEIKSTGMALPAALEWRSSDTKTTIPPQLADLLGLKGAVLGKSSIVHSLDSDTLIYWQRQGLEITSLRNWFANHFRRLPVELLSSEQSECEIFFSVNHLQSRLRLKRLFDLSLLIPCMLLATCGMLVYALLACLACPRKFKLRKPVFSKTTCIGLDGSKFKRLRFSTANDYLIPFSSLPQIWNIWKGEMSFVGPRPVSFQMQQKLELIEASFRLRLRSAPGLTGWGRLSGTPPTDPDLLRTELQRDLYYIRYANLSFDFTILIRALLSMLNHCWYTLKRQYKA